MRLQEHLRVAEGRQARVGAVAASELDAALASVSACVGWAGVESMPAVKEAVQGGGALCKWSDYVTLCCFRATTAAAQVSELKAELAQVKAQQERLKAEVGAAVAARDAAVERSKSLKAELEQLQFMLDEVHSAHSEESPSVKVLKHAAGAHDRC